MAAVLSESRLLNQTQQDIWQNSNNTHFVIWNGYHNLFKVLIITVLLQRDFIQQVHHQPVSYADRRKADRQGYVRVHELLAPLLRAQIRSSQTAAGDVLHLGLEAATAPIASWPEGPGSLSAS
jgi:hypothetical protein